MAQPTKDTKRRKKKGSVDPAGIAHIKATFNNTNITVSDEFGNVVGVAVAKLDAKYMFDKFGIIPENTNFGIKSNVVRSIMDSNGVDSPSANRSSVSKSQLGKMISNGTYYISCWMTMAQIEKMKAKKVFFSELE